MYGTFNSDKAMAVRAGAQHGEMLYSADGYVTAWCMWYLKNDENAAQAFIGDMPELMTNKLYQNQQLEFPKQKDIKKQPVFTCLQTKEYCY